MTHHEYDFLGTPGKSGWLLIALAVFSIIVGVLSIAVGILSKLG